MSSWTLLRHLVVFWDAIDNPVFLRELQRPPLWHGLYAWLARASGVALVVGGLGCYASALLVLYANNLLIVLVPLLLVWTVLVGLTLAPVVVGERERQTWETLQTTPLHTEMLVLGKASGALWWLRGPIRLMGGLLVLVATGIGLMSLILTPTGGQPGLLNLSSEVLCAATILVPLTSATVFVLDRLQQFVLLVMAALAASAGARSVRVALSAASAAAIGAWLVDAGLAVLVLAAQPERAGTTTLTDVLVLTTLGPSVIYLAKFAFSETVLLAGATLAVREIAVRLVWRWTVRAAREP